MSRHISLSLLFTEALEDMGCKFHLVLPWSEAEFRRTSVLPFEPDSENTHWEPLFDRALKAAASKREIGQVFEPGSDTGWEFMMEVTAGIALQTARALRLDLKPLVLWDRQQGLGAGGTSSFYEFWTQKMGLKPDVIPPPEMTMPMKPEPGGSGAQRCESSIVHQEVKSMLFADIVGYSKLKEAAVPAYIDTFLRRLGQLLSASAHAPCSVNTWGDALYAVFDYAKDAGLFALEMTRMLKEGKDDWIAKNLYSETIGEDGKTEEHPLDVRIGLHTGPVVMHYDPVVRRIGFTGAHVNRAARIEPIAEHGQVFASEEFAAMVELGAAVAKHDPKANGSAAEVGFVCEYAGTMQLAKGYPGRHRIYRVARKRVLVLERLARAVHESYCLESGGRAGTRASSLLPWDELSEDLRQANFAQVADISNKLRTLGLELAPGYGQTPATFSIAPEVMEQLAEGEHERWMEERRRQGWSYGAVRDEARKLHPSFLPWDELATSEKEKDRDTIRNLPMLVAKAGLRVRPIG